MAEADDLKGALDRLQNLVEAGYLLHSTLDLDEVLRRILAVAADGVGADRGTVFLVDRERGELWSRVLIGDTPLEIRLPVGQGIAGTVAATGDTIRVDDAYADGRFDRSWDERTGYRTRQILCAPIRNREGEIVGVFQLLNKRAGSFEPEDEEYLAALSVSAALALENARLHASALEKERYDREVALAQGVQRRFQPEQRSLATGALQAAGMNELCEDASGDYYDLIRELPDGRLGVAIGDVSGHGLQAALVMAEARALLRAFVRTVPELPRAIDLVNDFLVPDMTGGKFISLFAAVFDAETGAFEWCNAGHNPPLVHRAATGAIERLEGTGHVLGIVPAARFAAGEARTLEPGDTLLLYTDGATEARRPDGELYGLPRLEEALRRHAGAPPAALLESLRAALHAWTQAPRPDDDLTLLVVVRCQARLFEDSSQVE